MSELKVGDLAPAIDAVDQNGEKITLKEFRGKKVVLYFYPKDNTPGCTAEACNLRDNHSQFLEQDFPVQHLPGVGLRGDLPAQAVGVEAGHHRVGPDRFAVRVQPQTGLGRDQAQPVALEMRLRVRHAGRVVPHVAEVV